MRKWTFEQAIEAFENANGRDPFTGYTDVGRAILDLRERAEKAEQRCAALEAACIEVRRWFDPKDTYGNFNTSRHMVAAINAALSGDTSALREKLLQMGGLVWAMAAPDAEVDANTIKSAADSVMEGK